MPATIGHSNPPAEAAVCPVRGMTALEMVRAAVAFLRVDMGAFGLARPLRSSLTAALAWLARAFTLARIDMDRHAMRAICRMRNWLRAELRSSHLHPQS